MENESANQKKRKRNESSCTSHSKKAGNILKRTENEKQQTQPCLSLPDEILFMIIDYVIESQQWKKVRRAVALVCTKLNTYIKKVELQFDQQMIGAYLKWVVSNIDIAHNRLYITPGNDKCSRRIKVTEETFDGTTVQNENLLKRLYKEVCPSGNLAFDTHRLKVVISNPAYLLGDGKWHIPEGNSFLRYSVIRAVYGLEISLAKFITVACQVHYRHHSSHTLFTEYATLDSNTKCNLYGILTRSCYPTSNKYHVTLPQDLEIFEEYSRLDLSEVRVWTRKWVELT